MLIATKHGKEAAIAPVLEKRFGLTCHVAEDFDTDRFGTFTGEVARLSDPLLTVREKCEAAAREFGSDLVIASEGSFGPHPVLGWGTFNEEYLLLLDRTNNLCITGRIMSHSTNLNATVVSTRHDLLDFALGNGFPSHGMVLSTMDKAMCTKGIREERILLEIFSRYHDLSGEVRIETDMRAMMNPTRMELIEKTAGLLADRMETNCPSCHVPGFGITGALSGLPCRMCNHPTRSTQYYLLCCTHCNHEERRLKHSSGYKENPTYCDRCNP